MGWELIASGTKSDIMSMPGYEAQVDEGQKARLQFKFLTSVPTFQVDALRNSLTAAGVTDLQVVSKGSTVDVFYRKDPWWVPVIIVAVLAIAILLISWFFFKDVASVIGPIPTTMLIIGGSVLALAVGYTLVRRKQT